MSYNAKYSRTAMLAVIVFALCIFSANQLFAQVDEVKLPEGKAVVKKYLKAIGAEKAFEKINNTSVAATMKIPSVGIEGKLTRYATKPNKYYVKVEILGIGTVLRGCDGKVVWEIDPTQGPRIIKDEERETMLHFANFDMRDFEKQFQKIECIGEEKVGDEDCYKVKLTPLKAKPYTTCYSKKSGLELKSTLLLVNPMGEIEVVHLLSDYKAVDGLKYAHKMVEKAMGFDTVITTTSIKHNAELPKDCFELPQVIKDLIDKEKAGK